MFLAISPLHSTTPSAAPPVPSAPTPPNVVQHARPTKRVPQPTMHDDEFDRIVASMLRTIDSSDMNPLLENISTDSLTDDEFDEIICSLGKSVFGETPTSIAELNALGTLATTGDEAPILFLHGGASECVEVPRINDLTSQNKTSVVVRKTINNPLIDNEEGNRIARLKQQLLQQGYTEEAVESIFQTEDYAPALDPTDEASAQNLKELTAKARRKPKP